MATGLMLVALMIGAMQFFTFQNFGNYVDRMELEKLSGLSAELALEYRRHGNWEFIRSNPREWMRIFTRQGLINPRGVIHPEPRRFPGAPPPRDRGPDTRPNMMAVGPRISLFDTDHKVVMGKALSFEEQVSRPVLLDDRIVGYLGIQKLTHLPSPLDKYYFAQQKKTIYLVGGLFFILSVLISYLLALGFLAPIKKLSKAVRRLGKRQFDTRVDVTGSDELGQLAQDFNIMIDQLADYELKQKQWLSDISHELRTPVAVLISEIDAIQDGIRKPDPEAIQSIQAEVFRLNRLINDLHTLFIEEAKTLDYKMTRTHITELVGQVADRFASEFKSHGISVSRLLEDGQDSVVTVDRDRLNQVFSNIFKNTCQYTDPPARLVMSSCVLEQDILLTFEDTPPGVSDDKLGRLFDRLFRVDPSRSRKTGGSGIGLAICKNIVQRHGGSILALKSDHGGLRIDIRLPLTDR